MTSKTFKNLLSLMMIGLALYHILRGETQEATLDIAIVTLMEVSSKKNEQP